MLVPSIDARSDKYPTTVDLEGWGSKRCAQFLFLLRCCLSEDHGSPKGSLWRSCLARSRCQVAFPYRRTAEELSLDTVSHRATGPRLGGGRLAFGFSEEISGWLSAPTEPAWASGQGSRVAKISTRSSTVVRGLMMHTRMAGAPSKVVGVSIAVPSAINRSHHA